MPQGATCTWAASIIRLSGSNSTANCISDGCSGGSQGRGLPLDGPARENLLEMADGDGRALASPCVFRRCPMPTPSKTAHNPGDGWGAGMGEEIGRKLHLHARSLRIEHPETGKELSACVVSPCPVGQTIKSLRLTRGNSGRGILNEKISIPRRADRCRSYLDGATVGQPAHGWSQCAHQGQGMIAMILVVLGLYWLVNNTIQNLSALGKDFDFGFLSQPAGYDINQRLVEYTSQSTHGRAAIVGILNTILVAFLGCLLATILGVVAGILRLSKNWIVSRLMAVYVEGFRNVPLLLWIIAIFALMTESMPQPREFKVGGDAAMILGDSVAVTNRGVYVPGVVFENGFLGFCSRSIKAGTATVARVGPSSKIAGCRSCLAFTHLRNIGVLFWHSCCSLLRSHRYCSQTRCRARPIVANLGALVAALVWWGVAMTPLTDGLNKMIGSSRLDATVSSLETRIADLPAEVAALEAQVEEKEAEIAMAVEEKNTSLIAMTEIRIEEFALDQQIEPKEDALQRLDAAQESVEDLAVILAEWGGVPTAASDSENDIADAEEATSTAEGLISDVAKLLSDAQSDLVDSTAEPSQVADLIVATASREDPSILEDVGAMVDKAALTDPIAGLIERASALTLNDSQGVLMSLRADTETVMAALSANIASLHTIHDKVMADLAALRDDATILAQASFRASSEESESRSYLTALQSLGEREAALPELTELTAFAREQVPSAYRNMIAVNQLPEDASNEDRGALSVYLNARNTELSARASVRDTYSELGRIGLTPIDSRQIGGFLLALIIGIAGIVLSLPLGILLALGRQSHLFFVNKICVVFIEVIRGVPLIVWLFTASLLLNYFLPPGSNFDLIGDPWWPRFHAADHSTSSDENLDPGHRELVHWPFQRHHAAPLRRPEMSDLATDRAIDRSQMQVSDEVAIQITDMNKWYGTFHVLRDINLTVNRGERIVVCGPSGSGKSTLIRCINRLEEHQAGTIMVDGTELSSDLKNIDKIRSEVGMCFQHFNLFPHLTILENCTLAPIWVRKTPKKEAEETAMHFLEKVKIPDQALKYPGQLSGGQQQRVAIARSLCMKAAYHVV
ncbi:Glutamate/glutamine/aspartate/asparagine transport ATP-binding protein BztD [Nymphon striatum]|nr:Glutamate/glutamine/aspartate/asparagine transport ATP-binding protein BztD [Nymphon striatum]